MKLMLQGSIFTHRELTVLSNCKMKLTENDLSDILYCCYIVVCYRLRVER